MKKRKLLVLLTPLILPTNTSLAYWNTLNNKNNSESAGIAIGLFPFNKTIVLIDGTGPYALKKGDRVQHGETIYVALEDQVIKKVPSLSSLEGLVYWNSPSKMLNIDSTTHILSNYYDELSHPVESYGKSYIPLKRNPSQVFMPEIGLFTGWFCLEEDYSSNNDYLVAGTLVKYNGEYYYNTKRTINNLPTDPTYFLKVGDYEKNKYYEETVIIRYDNEFYYLRGSTSSSPSEDNNSWGIYSFEGYYQNRIVRARSVSANYQKGELVLEGYDETNRRKIMEIS